MDTNTIRHLAYRIRIWPTLPRLLSMSRLVMFVQIYSRRWGSCQFMLLCNDTTHYSVPSWCAAQWLRRENWILREFLPVLCRDFKLPAWPHIDDVSLSLDLERQTIHVKNCLFLAPHLVSLKSYLALFFTLWRSWSSEMKLIPNASSQGQICTSCR
jgi:hypothetical protein